MVDWTAWIKKYGKCCSCEGSLKKSRFINGIMLNKLATWDYPTWGNILLGIPANRASAIVCDTCLEQGKKPKYAIEWDQEDNVVKYHKVGDLRDVRAITPEDVMAARMGLA